MSSRKQTLFQVCALAAAVTLAYGFFSVPQADGVATAAQPPTGAAVQTSVPPSAQELLRPAVAMPVESKAMVQPITDSNKGTSAESDARGLVRAVSEATLSAGMVAQILKMPYAEGAAFKKGDLLVEFNCERPLAEQRAADAAMQVESKTVETNQELEHFNSIGKFDLLISVSKFNKAKAELEALNAQIKQCKIMAPFSGRVIENKLHQYESASVSQPLLRVVDISDLEVDVIVPSLWLRWLKPGAKFAFKVDETNKVTNAVVDRVLPSVDPVSKTIKIIGRFQDASGATIPGMSGTATFQKTES